MSKLKKVSDPSILNQLNSTSGKKKVTDPELLNQLNSNEDNENLMQKVVRYGLKDPAIGLMKMGREFANLPHKVTGGYLPEYSPSEFNFGEALGVNKPEAADKLIQGLSQYAPAFALPATELGAVGKAIGSLPKVGRFAAKALSESLPQAYYSALQSPHHAAKSAAEAGATMAPFSVLGELMGSANPRVKTLAKVLAGGGAGLLGREGAKQAGMGETMSDVIGMATGALGARGMDTKNDMMKRLSEGVSPDIANPRIEAANRLGLEYLTPAEANVSPLLAKRQGSLGRTEEGGKLLYEKSKSRQESERRAIDKTLDMIYSPGKMDKKVEEAYKSINQVNLPQEFPLQFKDNEIIKEAKKMVENTPAYKESLKSLMPKNVKLEPGQTDPQATSLVYWDHIKRAMDDMVNKSERAGNKNEARIISDTRAKMRDQMDEAYPEYKQARSLYERKMVRNGLEKVFDQKAVNGTNFYRALASEKKFDELMGHLRNAPEAAQNLKDMRLLFNDLMGPPTIKTAKGKEEYGMNMARNNGDFIHHLLEHVFTKGGNDKAAIEFITSKDWSKQLKEIKKISGKQMKLIALGMGLSKGVSQYAGQSD